VAPAGRRRCDRGRVPGQHFRALREAGAGVRNAPTSIEPSQEVTMLTRRALHMVVAGLAVAGCATDADGPVTAELPAGEALLMGQPSCGEAARRLGRDLGRHELRAPLGEPGELSLDEVNRVVIASESGRAIDWRADVGIDAVLVYGGRRTQAYVYDPEAREDTGLTAPATKLGVAPPVSEVVFCYDHELTFGEVSAKTAMIRTHRWSLSLEPEKVDITVPAGVVKAMTFHAAVAPTGVVDSAWTAHGEAVLANPTHAPVEVIALGDRAHELPVKVVCKGAPPFFVPAFGSLTCDWSVALPDGAPRTLVLEAQTRGEVGPAVVAVPIDLASAEVDLHDAKVWLWDYHAGFVGVTGEARVFEYELPLGPYAYCGSVGIFVDSATLYGHDTGRRVEARTWVRVKVPCE
jgi:hypothetical protein